MEHAKYAKHGNLVDTNASGAKDNTKHLESQKSFKVTHYGITEKQTRDYVLLYNNARLESENPTVIRRPLSMRNPCE